MQATFTCVHLITICVFSALGVTALAQDDQATTADEVARELASPNTVPRSLSFNLDYVTYKGDLPDASDQNPTRPTFQP